MDWLSQISSYTFEFIEAPAVNFPSVTMPADISSIPGDDIEALAVEARRFWKLGDGPISNILWLVENNGAVVSRIHLDADTLDGLSVWVGDRPYIVVTAGKESAARSRFDVAHELGHLLMHRHIDQAQVNSASGFKLIEQQAHRFASAFLFPQKSFALEAYPVTLDRFVELKRKWRTSVAMMMQRSADLGMVNEEQHRRLWRKYNWEQWRNCEPLDRELPIELPRLLQRSFDVILREGVQARADVLSRLALPASDIEKLAGLPHKYLSEESADIIDIQPRLRSKPVEQRPEIAAQVVRFPGPTSSGTAPLPEPPRRRRKAFIEEQPAVTVEPPENDSSAGA
ncbi:ImmA/IrrE family metallo-endopeptidase [Sorangium sp. So ce216]